MNYQGDPKKRKPTNILMKCFVISPDSSNRFSVWSIPTVFFSTKPWLTGEKALCIRAYYMDLFFCFFFGHPVLKERSKDDIFTDCWCSNSYVIFIVQRNNIVVIYKIYDLPSQRRTDLLTRF